MASPLKSREYEQAIERAAIEKLDTQLAAFIQEFAGTCLDYDPALEASIIEAIAHDDASDSKKDWSVPVIVKRGEIYDTTLPPQNGSEEYGRRLLLIVSNDKFNQDARWHSIIAVTVTKSPSQSSRGSVVFVPKGIANLKLDSWVLCHQVFVIDKNKLDFLIGLMPAKNMQDIERALKVALYLP